MKTNLLALVLLLCTPSIVWGQTENSHMNKNAQTIQKLFSISPDDTVQRTILEPVNYQITYLTAYQPVSGAKQPIIRWRQMLQLGDNYRRFINESDLLVDSLTNAHTRSGGSLPEYMAKLGSIKRRGRIQGDILFDTKKDQLEYHDAIMIDDYYYQEAIPKLNWTLLPGDTTIIGYTCHKASTHFRGRDYTAWYSEELPMPYGPYKFNGLPGLILCIYDSLHDRTYTCIGIEQGKGKVLYRNTPRSGFFTTTREKFHKIKKNYCAKPADYESPNFYFKEKPNLPPVLYNPIELE